MLQIIAAFFSTCITFTTAASPVVQEQQEIVTRYVESLAEEDNIPSFSSADEALSYAQDVIFTELKQYNDFSEDDMNEIMSNISNFGSTINWNVETPYIDELYDSLASVENTNALLDQFDDCLKNVQILSERKPNLSSSVSFWGIDLSAQDCRNIYNFFLSFANRYVTKAPSLGDLISAAAFAFGLNAYVAKFTSIMSSMLAKLIAFLKPKGPVSAIISSIVLIFSMAAIAIIGRIVYAGWENKSFKMGVKRLGFLRYEWVYESF
ncbi:MAG: hypothetical protein PUA93_07050 [Eubacteriales bacterium]|nr:hypothetical protein [Eubacteriales bacterium]